MEERTEDLTLAVRKEMYQPETETESRLLELLRHGLFFYKQACDSKRIETDSKINAVSTEEWDSLS